MKRYLLPILAGVLIASGCGKDDKEAKNGDSLGVPAITPPVQRNVPTGFGLALAEDTAVGGTPASRMVTTIKGYLDTSTGTGAVRAIERLKAIDDRMNELDTRAKSMPPRICLKEAAKDHTHAAAFPGTNPFLVKFQCMENVNDEKVTVEDSQMAFGLTDTNFYLMERAAAHKNAVVASANLNATRTEFWQLGNNEGESFIHLVAEDGVGMEFTSKGTGNDSLACGVHMKSNSTLVYVKGFDSAGGCSATAVEICLKAADLSETALDECSTAKLGEFTIPTLTAAELLAANGNATTIIQTPLTGYTSFKLGEEE